MRNTFIEELVSFARIDSKIALVVGDLGYSVVEPFAREFPERFINVGVAEQNMIGMAAGMASEGYHVFAYSIANFSTFRCAEQIRNDVAYHNLPVTVVSVGGGLAYGNLGYSHHAVQDYAVMRTFPNMLIAAPGDPMEVRACLRYLVNNRGPSYLRLGKAGEPNYHAEPPKISPGQWSLVRGASGKNAFLSTGACLQIAFEWANQPEYHDYDIYSMPLWSINSKIIQSDIIRQKTHVITIEDHLLDGGFGSWLLEACSFDLTVMCRISIKALSPIVCGTVGSQSTLNKFGGITYPKL